MLDYARFLLQADAADEETEDETEAQLTAQAVEGTWRGAHTLRRRVRKAWAAVNPFAARRRTQRNSVEEVAAAARPGQAAPVSAWGQGPVARIPAQAAAARVGAAEPDAPLSQDRQINRPLAGPSGRVQAAFGSLDWPSRTERTVAPVGQAAATPDLFVAQAQAAVRLGNQPPDGYRASPEGAARGAARLLTALRETARADVLIQQGGHRHSVAPQGSVPGGSPPEADVLALDRAVERDARRYDNGFSLF